MSDFGHELILLQCGPPKIVSRRGRASWSWRTLKPAQHVELSFDSDARAMYTAAFDEYSQALRRVALRNNGRYVGLPTDVPVDEAIFGPLVRAGAVE